MTLVARAYRVGTTACPPYQAYLLWHISGNVYQYEMSDNLETLRRKINGATELDSVVGTMKALAAASIVQYERAVQELGLGARFRRILIISEG